MPSASPCAPSPSACRTCAGCGWPSASTTCRGPRCFSPGAGGWRGPANRAIFAVAAAGAVASIWYPPAGFAVALGAGAGPLGLGLRGRTSRLVWTGRLRRLTGLCTALAAFAIAVPSAFGLHQGFTAAAICAIAAPALVDAALWLARPHREPLPRPLRRQGSPAPGGGVAPGGGHYRLLREDHDEGLRGPPGRPGTCSVVATPASFNNTAGLARAVNEHFATGTQVFVAEMGTYGPGEIKAMCEWAAPEIALITAIGPVHLERMGTWRELPKPRRKSWKGRVWPS